VETFAINYLVCVTGISIANVQRADNLPALDGLRREKFNLNLLTDS